MIAKSLGIAVHVEPFSRSSQIVTWLSPHYGRTPTLLKGALRKNSGYVGQVDLFYTCEIIFYRRERSGIHIMRECAAVNGREGLRADWRGFTGASYLADLAARLCPAGDGHAPVYELLTQALDDLATEGASQAVTLWFELQILGLLGFAPRLGACAACGQPRGLLPAGTPTAVSIARGGILCAACRAASDQPTYGLRGDVLAMLHSWQGCPACSLARRTVGLPGQFAEAAHFLGRFLEYHLDPPPRGRRLALDAG